MATTDLTDYQTFLRAIPPISDLDRRMARFSITAELLGQLLNLPEGTKVIALLQGWNRPGVEIDMIIQHPDLPPVDPGMVTPHLNPTLKWEDGVLTISRWDYGTPDGNDGNGHS